MEPVTVYALVLLVVIAFVLTARAVRDSGIDDKAGTPVPTKRRPSSPSGSIERLDSASSNPTPWTVPGTPDAALRTITVAAADLPKHVVQTAPDGALFVDPEYFAGWRIVVDSGSPIDEADLRTDEEPPTSTTTPSVSPSPPLTSPAPASLVDKEIRSGRSIEEATASDLAETPDAPHSGAEGDPSISARLAPGGQQPAAPGLSVNSQKKAIGCGAVILVLVVLWVIGTLLGGSDDDDSPPSNVSPAVISRIEGTRNCAALQGEFDTADLNGNTQLMAFIDSRMRDVGCHG